MEKEINKINQAYSRNLKSIIKNGRELNYSDTDIYDRLLREYGLTVSILSKNFPELQLRDIAPMTKIFTDFKKEYLGE